MPFNSSSAEAYEPSARAKEAMRAFLQRSEVRLSTMHRVAGVFLNGAGLLLLFPILFKDAVGQVIDAILHGLTSSQSVDVIVFACIAVAFAVSLGIPLYALWLLIKDIVTFYFTVHTPGYEGKIFNPRFVLSGLAFPIDEDVDAKNEVYRLQYTTDLNRFVLPANASASAYYGHVYDHYGESVVPSTRQASVLKNYEWDTALSPERKTDQDRLNAALGLSGFLDRSITEEVARAELSMVRHGIALRRLVLRYMKALIVIIWTTLVSFLILAVSQAIDLRLAASPDAVLLWKGLAFALGYLVWSVLTLTLVRMPVRWITLAHRDLEPLRDPELLHFEHRVRNLIRIATVAALIALAIIGLRLFNVPLSF